jgi:hypothetical protein
VQRWVLEHQVFTFFLYKVVNASSSMLVVSSTPWLKVPSCVCSALVTTNLSEESVCHFLQITVSSTMLTQASASNVHLATTSTGISQHQLGDQTIIGSCSLLCVLLALTIVRIVIQVQAANSARQATQEW